jgi:phosphatidylglycerol lysyltransferase
LIHLKRFAPAISLLLLTAALVFIWHEIEHIQYAQVRSALHRVPRSAIAIAVVLTILNYLVLIAYDYLAVRSIGKSVPLRFIAIASFVGFSTSYNFSSLLGGPAIRFRFYSKWGFTPQELVGIMVMIGATYWVGVAFLGSILFIIEDMPLPTRLPFSTGSTRWIGCILAVIVSAYLAWVVSQKSVWRIGGAKLTPPSVSLTVQQIAVAALDLVIAAGAMYALVGADLELRYDQFVAVYLLATLATVISNVPGGVGVFESVFLAFALSDATSSLVASLILFRIIYYLLPLMFAMLFLGWCELVPMRGKISTSLQRGTQWWPSVAPYVISVMTFGAGTILILSGATPGIVERIQFLVRWVPAPLLEISHFLGSIVGACLLVLARGLYRRLDSAYFLTCFLLVAGILFSLVKGIDFEEALFLSVVLAALVPARRAFYRNGNLIHERLSPSWLLAIAVVAICGVWLGLFSSKHVDYQDWEWWRFLLDSEAPRALRTGVAVTSVLTFFGVMRLISQYPPVAEDVSSEDIDKAFEIACKHPRTYAHLAVLGDKQLLFNEDRTAFVMYARQGRSWVSMGDPVGPADAISELVWRFRELVDRYGGRPIFYEVGVEHLTAYLDQGLMLLKIGEEGRVPLQEFGLQGSSRKGLRQTYNRLTRDAFEFEVLPPEKVSEVLGRLREISDHWLAKKGGREKGFSLGFFNEATLVRYPCGVIKKDSRIVAFANILPSESKSEVSIDLMRYDVEGVSGLMEYLFIELLLWGKAEGYQWFSLGMAPLSGIESTRLSPLWNRMAQLLFTHGDRFYSFEGLRQFKEKFDPKWEGRYIALPKGLAFPKMLADMTLLIAKRH